MARRISRGPTAHQRFKASFWPTVGAAMAVSTVAHFAVFAMTRFEAHTPFEFQPSQPMTEVTLRLPRVDVPPPPDIIGRPAIPVIATEMQLVDDITIPEVSFDEPPIEAPPPPVPEAVDISKEPVFTPYQIRPRIANEREFERALSRLYPERLQRAGVSGRTILWIFIDEVGKVRNTRIVSSSGFDDLDEAALMAVRETARFTPAINRDQRVPVWVQLPISFVARG